MHRLKPPSSAYFFLAVWVLLILILYFSINLKNIVYCVEVYHVLLRYPKTLLLLLVPSLVVGLVAVMHLIKSRALRRG